MYGSIQLFLQLTLNRLIREVKGDINIFTAQFLAVACLRPLRTWYGDIKVT